MFDKFNLNTRKFISADFSGQYVAEKYKITTNSNYSNLDLVNGKLTNVVESNYSDLISDDYNTFFYNKLVNLEVYLNHEDIKDKFVFIEEFKNFVIKDIKLSNFQKDGNNTYGIISGRIVCALQNLEEFDIFNSNTYTIDKEIDFGDTKDKFFLLLIFTKLLSKIKFFFNKMKSKFFPKR